MGGAVAAVESGYMKQALVSSHAARRARIENGEDVVVGVNRFETTEPSPLTADLDAAIQTADPEAEKPAIASVEAWKAERDEDRVRAALAVLAEDAKTGANLMTATLEAARAGATTGEWAGTLREVFGEFRAPTGVGGAVGCRRRGVGRCRTGPGTGERAPDRRGAAAMRAVASGCWSGSPGSTATPTAPSRSPCAPVTPASRSSTRASGSPPSRSSPRRWPRTSTASGCRSCPARTWSWCRTCSTRMKEHGLDDVPVIVGGIIPDSDARRLGELGVAAVFTPKDFSLTDAWPASSGPSGGRTTSRWTDPARRFAGSVRAGPPLA